MVNGSDPRVYYLDTGGFVHELAWNDGGWTHTNVTWETTAPPASLTALCSCVVSGSDPRIYIIGPFDHVFELAWDDGGWQPATDVTKAASYPPEPAPSSPLSCCVVNGNAPRVYYRDGGGDVEELAWTDGGWQPTDVTDHASGAPQAAPTSALSSGVVNGSDPRIYYLDPQSFLHELAWNDGGGTTRI